MDKQDDLVYIQILYKDILNNWLYIAYSSYQWEDKNLSFQQRLDSWHNLNLNLKDFEDKTGIHWLNDDYSKCEYKPQLILPREIFNQIKQDG